MATRKNLKDPEWQRIKVILSGKWHNPANNIGLLRDYLDDFSNPSKIRKVSNYLTGFRSDGNGQVEICDLLRDIKLNGLR